MPVNVNFAVAPVVLERRARSPRYPVDLATVHEPVVTTPAAASEERVTRNVAPYVQALQLPARSTARTRSRASWGARSRTTADLEFADASATGAYVPPSTLTARRYPAIPVPPSEPDQVTRNGFVVPTVPPAWGTATGAVTVGGVVSAARAGATARAGRARPRTAASARRTPTWRVR